MATYEDAGAAADMGSGSRVRASAPIERKAGQSFVFFPEPPEQQVSIYRELEVPLPLPELQPSATRGPRLQMAPTVAAASVQTARRTGGALKNIALGLRLLTLDGRVNIARVAILAAVPIAVGFLIGTMYPRQPSSAAPVEQVAARAPSPPVAAPAPAAPAPAPSSAFTAPAPTPKRPAAVQPSDPPAAAAPVASPVAPAALVTTRRRDIPDAEVRQAAQPRPAAATAATTRRPLPVVVHAVEEAKPAAATGSARRATGVLLVVSEPQGAEVSINGVVQGRTPLTIRGIAAGSRVVRLDLPGYRRWSWGVAVAADKQTPLRVKLQPE